MPGDHMNLGQSVSVQVIRASSKVTEEGYLKEAIICEFCGNKRKWLVRCESCGRNEQEISLED